MLTVDQFERIRRMVILEGCTQREAARRLHHSRKTIKKALQHSSPPGYRLSRARPKPVIEPYRELIDSWLDQNKDLRRKQCYTAQRIYDILRDEYGFTGSASAVRRYVATRKPRGEVFMPLLFDPGEEAQVDWCEGYYIENGREKKGNFFCMRLCHSKASFVYPYERQDQESFLDGHVRAFEFFGGVPLRLAYDNLKSAVIHVGKGQDRRLTKRFKELRSHYLFETRFCNVARGNEKGSVENLAKFVQRNLLTPMPEVTCREELAQHLLAGCRAYQERKGVHSDKTYGELLAEERDHLLPLPETPFAAYLEVSTFSDKQSLVNFDTNKYSVPVEKARLSCQVRGYVDRVECYVSHELVATHRRHYGQGEYILEPLHYVPLLKRKPGSLDNARAFKGHDWGEGFAEMRRELEYRYGGEGTKKFINILLLQREFGEEAVQLAVKKCVYGCAYSDEAVRGMLTGEPSPRPSPVMDLTGQEELAAVSSGIRSAATYECLCSGEVGQ